jgi:hypothetical protein
MSYLDLLRGEEPYKVRRSSSVIRTHRLMMGQRRATWIPYAAYHTLRSRAKWYICYEAVPEWIKTTMVRYHALRYAGKRWVNKVRRY